MGTRDERFAGAVGRAITEHRPDDDAQALQEFIIRTAAFALAVIENDAWADVNEVLGRVVRDLRLEMSLQAPEYNLTDAQHEQCEAL